MLGPAEHLGEWRWDEVNRSGPQFLWIFSTQILADPLRALENLTFCKNEETEITALPIAW